MKSPKNHVTKHFKRKRGSTHPFFNQLVINDSLPYTLSHLHCILRNRPLASVLISGVQDANNLKYLKRGTTKTGPPVTFLSPHVGKKYVELLFP